MTEKINTKREQLLQSALHLFAEHGINNTSTASIARHAGVASGTLFHHFDNKKSLIAALYISLKHQLAQQLTLTDEIKKLPLKTQAHLLWNKTIDWSINNPQALIVCQQIATDNILPLTTRLDAMKQELSVLHWVITQGQQQGIVANYPLDLMLDQCHAQIIASGLFFINNAQQQQTQYKEASFNMFWQALAALETQPSKIEVTK